MGCWSQILVDIMQREEGERLQYLDSLRRGYLENIAKKTGRNVISYYSAWMYRPNVPDIEINDKDINALMENVYGLDRSKGLDLILHTPGGDIAATEQIINYLHSVFDGNIRAIVPQMAMSAGSMISVSCNTIIMGRQSCLGPFDPQFNGLPCQSVRKEFKKALEDIQANPGSLGLWQVVFSKYTPTFILSCEQAEQLADELVRKLLKRSVGAPDKIDKILKLFGDNDESKTHSRHIDKEKCKNVGLNILDLESDQELQDLILSLHHCYMITLENTSSAKLVENNAGGSYVRIINSQK